MIGLSTGLPRYQKAEHFRGGIIKEKIFNGIQSLSCVTAPFPEVSLLYLVSDGLPPPPPPPHSGSAHGRYGILVTHPISAALRCGRRPLLAFFSNFMRFCTLDG